MKSKGTSRFAAILFVIGLMGAIQFNTIHEAETPDTRDIWEIRQALTREMQLHSELLSDISSLDETLGNYQETVDNSPERALKSTVEDLKRQAGEAEVTGPGIEVRIEPSAEAVAFGYEIDRISPDLLVRFRNEINRFNAQHMSIDGKRVIGTTAIRDINGETTVNGLPVQTPPFTIKIVANTMDDAEKLYNHLLASPIQDDFYIDNLSLSVSEPSDAMNIEAYSGKIESRHLHPVKGER